MSSTMQADIKRPLSQRFNMRLIMFFAVVVLLVGLPLSIYIRQEVRHGITDRGDVLEVNLKAMSDFEIDQRFPQNDEIPEVFRKLDGKRVMMTGEIPPNFSIRGGLDEFEVCYSVAKCCMSGTIKLQHFVRSTPKPGVETMYYPGQVKVVGTLRVGVEKRPDGKFSIYRLEVESLKPI